MSLFSNVRLLAIFICFIMEILGTHKKNIVIVILREIKHKIIYPRRLCNKFDFFSSYVCLLCFNDC